MFILAEFPDLTEIVEIEVTSSTGICETIFQNSLY